MRMTITAVVNGSFKYAVYEPMCFAEMDRILTESISWLNRICLIRIFAVLRRITDADKVNELTVASLGINEHSLQLREFF